MKEIDKKISEQRLKIIQKKLFDIQIKKNRSIEGTLVNVLVENQMKDKIKLFGRTELMNPVIFNGDVAKIGSIVKVKIESSNQNTLFGTIVENYKKKVA